MVTSGVSRLTGGSVAPPVGLRTLYSEAAMTKALYSESTKVAAAPRLLVSFLDLASFSLRDFVLGRDLRTLKEHHSLDRTQGSQIG